MAKYTTEVRSMVEAGVDIFDFEYPIFDEDYRNVLETKIIDYYYFREIGLETVGQFKHFLKSKMNRIMPYYNQLYETENLITKEDYNINLNTIETHTRTVDTTTNNTTVLDSVTVLDGKEVSDGTSTEGTNATTTDTGTNKSTFSDTPQAKLNDLDYATEMTEGSTGNTNTVDSDSTGTSNVTVNTDNTQTVDDTTTNNGKINTIEDFQIKLEGGGGVRYNSDVLMEWRKTFLRIDQMVIDELNDLFMNIM